MIIPPCFPPLRICFPSSHLRKTYSPILTSKSPVYGIFKGMTIIILPWSLLLELCFLVILFLHRSILPRTRRRPNANRLKLCGHKFKAWKQNLDTLAFMLVFPFSRPPILPSIFIQSLLIVIFTAIALIASLLYVCHYVLKYIQSTCISRNYKNCTVSHTSVTTRLPHFIVNLPLTHLPHSFCITTFQFRRV